jgi:hypothetical protein
MNSTVFYFSSQIKFQIPFSQIHLLNKMEETKDKMSEGSEQEEEEEKREITNPNDFLKAVIGISLF